MRRIALAFALLCLALPLATAHAQWAQTAGPTGGAITGISIHPSNGHVLAVGNNAVFRSTDAGVTWTPLFNGLPYDVQYSAVGFGAACALTGGAGGAGNVVYRSTDDGVTWTQALNAGMPLASFFAFTFVGSTALVASSSGVYASTDNGDHWNPTTGLPANFSAATFASDGGANLYVGSSAASGTKGVYRSVDGGATWAATNVTFLTTAYCAGVAANANAVFAATSTNGTWRSVDQGGTWTKINPDVPSGFNSCITATATNLWIGNGNAIRRADANGNSWTLVTTGLPPSNAGNSTAVIAVSGASVLAGIGKWGVYRTTDLGANWAASNTGIRSLKINNVHTSHGWVYAAADGLGFFRSNDGGTTWQAMTNGIPAYSGAFGFARTTAGTLLAGSSGFGQLYRSIDDGATWTPSSTNLALTSAYAFSVNGGDVYATGYHDVCKSTDDGQSWTTLPSGLTFTQTALDLLEDGPYMVVGCNAGIKRSIDYGATWTAPMSGQPGFGSFYSFALVDTVQFMASQFGVYRSLDRGATWTAVAGVTSPFALVARNHDLYAGTTNGVQHSTDYGATWTTINEGLPVNLAVWDLAYDANYLYLGSANTSVWRRPLAQVAAAPLARVATGVALAQAAPNPVTGATRIGFTLPHAGRVRLDVLDAAGRHVATLVDGTLPAGGHDARWDVTRDAGGRVAPGVYFVRLEAAGARLARRLLVLE